MSSLHAARGGVAGTSALPIQSIASCRTTHVRPRCCAGPSRSKPPSAAEEALEGWSSGRAKRSSLGGVSQVGEQVDRAGRGRSRGWADRSDRGGGGAERALESGSRRESGRSGRGGRGRGGCSRYHGRGDAPMGAPSTLEDIAEALVRLPAKGDVGTVLRQARVQLTAPKLTTLLSLLRAAAAAPSVTTALLRWASTQLGEPLNRIHFNSAISTMAAAGRWRSALGLLQEMRQATLVPDLVTFNAVITAFEKGGEPARAMQMLQTMREEGVSPDTITYSALISACAKPQPSSDRATTSTQIMELLEGYDDGERWRRTAEQLFRTMVAEGVVPNTTTYNALLAVHAAARSTEGAEAAKMTLEALEAHPTLQPDRVSYETAISAFAIPDWWEEALRVPERMQLQGIAPVVRTLNALLAAATTPNQCVAARAAIEAAAAAVRVPTAATDERRIARRGGWRGGNEVETTEGGDAPPTLMYDVITFNTLLRAHARVGDVDGACSLLQEMRDNGFAPDAVSYTAVMQACTTVGDWVQAQALYDQARAEGLRVDSRMRVALISALGRAGRMREAMEQLEAMGMGEGGPGWDVFALNAGLAATAVHGEWRVAEAVWRRLIANGVKPDTVSYSTMVDTCGRAGEWRKAMQWFEDMEAASLVPDLVAFNALINACAKGQQWDRARGVFQEMEAYDVEPDVVTYTSMMNAFEKGGKCNEALDMYREMQAAGVRPNVQTFSMLMAAYIKGGRWDDAMDLFGDMQALQVVPDAKMFAGAMAAARWQQQQVADAPWSRVSELVARMEALGVTPDDAVVDQLISAIPDDQRSPTNVGPSNG